MKIYTKTGDTGDTRLFDGTKVRKSDFRVDAYGNVDELNAVIGAAAAFVQDSAIQDQLAQIQKDLFSVGAQLADPQFRGRESSKFQLRADRVLALESAIDQFETELPPLRQFILAGGGQAGALVHVARTVCRRAERRVVELADTGRSAALGGVDVNHVLIEYLNRLSDFLFVLARVLNHREGKQEIPW